MGEDTLDRQNRKLEQLYDWMAEMRVSVAIIRAQQEEFANRPPLGVPVWVVLLMALPPTLIALFLIALVTLLYLRPPIV